MELLPEGCISHILSLTTPRDACRSSLVSQIFRSAANSDFLWERFLPADYEEIISRLISPVAFSSKKELYFRLCDHPILIDDGNKSFALEKWSGKKCYMIGARELSISGGDDPRDWMWKPLAESRFSEVAELIGDFWFDIRGRMETRMLSPRTTYVAYLVFKITDHAYGLEFPAQVVVRLSEGGDDTLCSESLDPTSRLSLRQRWFGNYVSLMYNPPPPPPEEQVGDVGLFHHPLPEEQLGDYWAFVLTPQDEERLLNREPLDDDEMFDPLPRMRGDGWKEIMMGEFYNDHGEDGEVLMYLMEPNAYDRKGGLIIQGIELRPKRQ